MRLLFCGDVVGAPGVRALRRYLPGLKRDLELDFVVANGENAADGYGPSPDTCEQLFNAGIDVVTSGNHIWDNAAIIPYSTREPRLLRPHNYPDPVPGTGVGVYGAASGHRVCVINLMARTFMEPLDDPFAAADRLLEEYRLGETADALLIDLHGETTSEKMAFGHAFDGRASLIVGTHTHVPTADTRILPGGTAFQADAGMCGDYQSVIGYQTEPWIARFRTKMRTGRIRSATGEGSLAGVFVETADGTGLAIRADPVRVGGHLPEAIPRL